MHNYLEVRIVQADIFSEYSKKNHNNAQQIFDLTTLENGIV